MGLPLCSRLVGKECREWGGEEYRVWDQVGLRMQGLASPLGDQICSQAMSQNDSETSVLAPTIMTLSRDREMECWVSGYFLLVCGIDVEWSIPWRRAVLCCSCVMAWNIAVPCYCENFWHMLIIHSRNRSTMIMRIKRDNRHCPWQKTW